MVTESRPVTVAYGDGIGPEIMEAVLAILKAAGARLTYEVVEVGKKVYESGVSSGITDETWDSLRRTGVMLKAPITTPQGGGYKSLNVTLRKSLSLYANVRPCRSFEPFVLTKHPGTDVLIVRENEEDTYGGIEYRHTAEVTECLKLMTHPGSERIIRYAFAFAKQQGRKKVTCLIKDNIMKITDGLFHRVFDEVALEYPEIQADAQIVDIGTARLAKDPTKYDVVVLPNLYGDIISDVAAELTGSVGLGGSANIGEEVSMFEAIHGSAPDIAGKGIANPSGLLNAAVMMLDHLDQSDVAETIEKAWLRALEDGIRTGDIEGYSEVVDTQTFAEGVIDRLGQSPDRLMAHHRTGDGLDREAMRLRGAPRPAETLAGADVFVDWHEAGRDPEVLGKQMVALSGEGFDLKAVSNRGTKVWPDGLKETFRTDQWCCRFLAKGDVSQADVLGLVGRVMEAGFPVIKFERLCLFDGERGWALGQGE